jgi:hypothetical protein
VCESRRAAVPFCRSGARRGRDLRIRTVDLMGAGVFSAKVARMCPKLRVSDPAQRRVFVSEFLTFDQAARIVGRPVSEVRYLASIGTLNSVRFGRGAHRLHQSEVTGPGMRRFRDTARPYRELKHHRPFGWGCTVNDTAHYLRVCERTVLRWIGKGALTAVEATRIKWRRTENGWSTRMEPGSTSMATPSAPDPKTSASEMGVPLGFDRPGLR